MIWGDQSTGYTAILSFHTPEIIIALVYILGIYVFDEVIILDKDELQHRLQTLSAGLDAFKLRPWSLSELHRIKAELLLLDKAFQPMDESEFDYMRLELALMRARARVGDLYFKILNYSVLVLSIALVGAVTMVLT